MLDEIPTLNGCLIRDAEGAIAVEPWMNALVRIGWTASEISGTGTRTVFLLAMPSRRGAALLAAFGAAIGRIRLADHLNAWEVTRTALPGTEFLVRRRRSNGRVVLLRVVVERTGPIADFDGEDAVTLRVVKGPRDYANATLIWDWNAWKSQVLPSGTPERRIQDGSQRAGAEILQHLAGTPVTPWLFSDQKTVTIVGEKDRTLDDASELSFSLKSGGSLCGHRFLDGTLPQISCQSVRSFTSASAPPVLILNGRDALLEVLKSGIRSSTIVLLEWSELDLRARNHLANWLEHDDRAIQAFNLDGLDVPKSWQVVSSTFRTRIG